jgi:hypothetical protein
MMQMLINAGTDMNIQDGRYGNALQAALYRDHDKVVKMLMDAGAVEWEDSIEDSESDDFE